MHDKYLKSIRVDILHTPHVHITLDTHMGHYIVDVLRLKIGDMLEVVDKQGNYAKATLMQHQPCCVLVHDICAAADINYQLTIATAIPKGDRADWLVEKLAEIGATHIHWITYQRSVVHPHAHGNKQARWQRMLEAACGQSKQRRMPILSGPYTLSEWFTHDHHATTHGFVAHTSDAVMLQDIAHSSTTHTHVTLLIGPEGGLTAEELQQAKIAGYTEVSLGPSILRVETAAIVGCVLALANIRNTTRCK